MTANMENRENVDDLILGITPKNVPTPPEDSGENEESYEEKKEEIAEGEENYNENEENNEESEDDNEEESLTETEDDYGNIRKEKKEKPKLYTKEEVDERINEAVRERLSRLERNGGSQSAASQSQVEKQIQNNFEFDESASGTWQQQLDAFVKQTFLNIEKERVAEYQRKVQEEYQTKELAAQRAFEERFVQGANKFADFKEKVTDKNFITEAMAMSTRSLANPAAFIYAAASRAPKELERISKIADPYAQILEMGKLEERLRTPKKTTKTPKPLSKNGSDAATIHKIEKAVSVDDLLAQSDAKRLAARRNRSRK